MRPIVFGAGESQKPRATFKDFQAFTDAAREYAARYGLQRSADERFHFVLQVSSAANDNVPAGASAILLSDVFMDMLNCWIQCDRDMVLAKLTYNGS